MCMHMSNYKITYDLYLHSRINNVSCRNYIILYLRISKPLRKWKLIRSLFFSSCIPESERNNLAGRQVAVKFYREHIVYSCLALPTRQSIQIAEDNARNGGSRTIRQAKVDMEEAFDFRREIFIKL